jgi:hypothetical protein
MCLKLRQTFGDDEDILQGYAKTGSEGNAAANWVNIKKEHRRHARGEKKRVKPWRIGSRSQQQMAPKGHSSGFRGKQGSAGGGSGVTRLSRTN